MPNSQLLMPGPQQMVRGALPMVPRGTAPGLLAQSPGIVGSHGVLLNELGSNPRLPGPRGSSFLNGATRFGSPGVSKSKLDCSSVSSCDVIRTGKPLWNVVIPETAQPFSAFPANPLYFGTGSSQ